MAVKQFDEAAKFIEDNMKCISEKPGKVTYQVNRDPFKKFLTTKGIAKDTIDQINDATNEYYNGSITVVKNLLKKHNDEPKISLRTRTPGGRIDTSITRKVKSRNPESGKTFNRFGVVAIRMRLKSQMNKELVAECATEIEAASA